MLLEEQTERKQSALATIASDCVLQLRRKGFVGLAEGFYLQALSEKRDPVLLAAVAEYGYTQDTDELKGLPAYLIQVKRKITRSRAFLPFISVLSFLVLCHFFLFVSALTDTLLRVSLRWEREYPFPELLSIISSLEEAQVPTRAKDALRLLALSEDDTLMAAYEVQCRTVSQALEISSPCNALL